MRTARPHHVVSRSTRGIGVTNRSFAVLGITCGDKGTIYL